MNKEFNQILANYQKKINKEIKFFFDREVKQNKKSFLKEVLKILREFSLRPAKRIRAALVNYGYFLAGGKNKKAILKVSIFIELIHNFLLIHDDIIDRDKFRRGGLTIQYQYQKLSSLKNTKEKEHYGDSMAIVIGDIINLIGYKILNSANFPEKYKLKAVEKLNQVLYLTGYGQALELWLREKIIFNKKIKEKEIFEIYKNKTAFYTFIGPLQIGAILAGADRKFLEKIEKTASPLGIAFQIRDDIQEIFHPKKEPNKPLISDIKERQPNLLIIKTLEKEKYQKKLRNYLGKNRLNEEDLKIVKNIFTKSGSLQYCKEKMEKLINQVKKDLISEKKFPKKEKQFILNLADYLLKT